MTKTVIYSKEKIKKLIVADIRKKFPGRGIVRICEDSIVVESREVGRGDVASFTGFEVVILENAAKTKAKPKR